MCIDGSSGDDTRGGLAVPGAVRGLSVIVMGALYLLLEMAKLISATIHTLKTSQVFRVACSEPVHGADTFSMGIEARHSPRNLARAYLSHT